MISSELPEVLGMADRVLVMREGRITAELDRADADARDRHVRRHARGSGRMTTVPTAAAPAPRRRRHRRARETGILLALVLVVDRRDRQEPGFLFSADGFRDLLLTPSILVLLAVGQAIVIITRNVDLSVGSVLGPRRPTPPARCSSTCPASRSSS